jgi:hypothetical protein
MERKVLLYLISLVKYSSQWIAPKTTFFKFYAAFGPPSHHCGRRGPGRLQGEHSKDDTKTRQIFPIFSAQLVRAFFTKLKECQAFFPVVLIGSPQPLTRKRVLLPPLGPRGDTLACGGGGWGDPILTMGQTLWYSRYTKIPLRSS